MTTRRPIPVILLIAVLVFIVAMAFLFPPAQWIPAEQWGSMLESKGPPGVVAFVAVAALATSIGLPRQMVAFIAGIAYGAVYGLLVSLVAALSGCLLTVLFSRRFLSGWVTARFPKPIGHLQSFVNNDAFVKILILRLQPLGTNLLTNTCVGFTTLSLPLFLSASALGYVPQMLVFNMMGSGVRVGSDTQLLLSAVLLIISVVLGLFLVRKYRHNKTVSDSAQGSGRGVSGPEPGNS